MGKTIRSVRTSKFKADTSKLPERIQELAKHLFKLFQANPNDPILDTHNLADTKKGRHRKGSRAVAVSARYRAIYVIDNGKTGNEEAQVCWYWIGSHESYNGFVGSKRK